MSLIQDIDLTILNKSLKLLHSAGEDAADQLRIIVEETFRNKYGTRKQINLPSLSLNKKTSHAGDVKKAKKFKVDGKHSSSTAVYLGKDEESQSSNSDSGDVFKEILDDDLACVICREMAVAVNNNLVECLECHSLYHQECHYPPIVQDTNDPRLAWYCSKCTKSMNKAVYASKGSPGSNSQQSKVAKSISKSSTSSSKSHSASTSSSKLSSSKPVPPSIPKINISPGKRLQLMKKNAAKKHEKKKSSK